MLAASEFKKADLEKGRNWSNVSVSSCGQRNILIWLLNDIISINNKKMSSSSENKPQAPCKTFRKKKSLACYQLKFNIDQMAFDHYEFYRIVNPKAGEYYLLPIEVLQKQINHHISYHKSGAFHWRTEEGGRIFLKDGEADYRSASLLKQAMSYLSYHLDGYCLSIGRKVDKKALKSMLQIMDGYILPSIDPAIAAEMLFERKNFI